MLMWIWPTILLLLAIGAAALGFGDIRNTSSGLESMATIIFYLLLIAFGYSLAVTNQARAARAAQDESEDGTRKEASPGTTGSGPS